MGSSVTTVSSAADNRQAVTDNGIGVSGNGNLSLGGHVLDFTGVRIGSPSATATNKSAAVASGGGSGAGGGSLNVNILDNGAINRAFDFSQNALSSVLASVLDSQQTTLQGSQAVADSVGAALTNAAEINAEAQAGALTWLQTNLQKLLIGGGVILLGYWYMKGRKK